MTDPLDHPAEGPEQEITSDAEQIVEATAAAQVEPAEALPIEEEFDAEPEVEHVPDPNQKLERLQKILAQAGVASRRHAEELITAGRVQVNGQVVNVLGAKADAARDHIRVDGKLLHGAERLRYFVLNKPKGYVTTVSDPVGRPTVMGFFSKMGERLYPVGRLDYLSEGLLLITNDGELANSLTRAAAGVEKTYLVKVAGQPSEEAIEQLRQGVTIERGSTNAAAGTTRRSEGKVRTAQARIRQIRPGDNPWFEVVLIEGRNRELRKMFEQIGHHVEKIRRVGYGPLVLDLEPGKIRELEPAEVDALRLTAAGKLKPRRMKTTHMLPKEAGLSTEYREQKRAVRAGKPYRPKFDRGGQPGSRPPERRSAPPFPRPAASGFQRPERTFKPRTDQPAGGASGGQFEDRGKRFERGSLAGGRKPFGKPEGRRWNERPGGATGARPPRREGSVPSFRAPFRKTEGGPRRPAREAGNLRGGKPAYARGPERSQGTKPQFEKGAGFRGTPRFNAKPGFGGKPRFEERQKFDAKPSTGDWPRFDASKRAGAKPRFDEKPRYGAKPPYAGKSKLIVSPVTDDRARFDAAKGPQEKPRFDAKPKFAGKPKFGGKPRFDSKQKAGGRTKPSAGTGAKTGGRPSRPGGKPGSRPSKFGGRPGGKPSGRARSGPGGRPGSKPGGKPRGKKRD